MPAARQTQCLFQLTVTNGFVKNGLPQCKSLKIDIIHHHANQCTHAAFFNKRRKELSAFFHLKNRSHPATQQLCYCQRADDLALVTGNDATHRQIQPVRGCITDIFSPTAKDGIPHVIVCADKTG